eukprot:3748200-Rhodomonas_salina.2
MASVWWQVKERCLALIEGAARRPYPGTPPLHPQTRNSVRTFAIILRLKTGFCYKTYFHLCMGPVVP